MFEDISKKNEILQDNLGIELTTKLDVNTIAQQIFEKHKYYTDVKLEFNICKLKKGILKMTMTHNGKVTDYFLRKEDNLIFTHHFNVDY